MAKKAGKSKGAVSAGINSNVSRKTLNALRADKSAGPDRTINQLKAFRSGKRVMVTIPNPNLAETNKPFIRVLASEIWKNKENTGYSQN